MDEGDSCSYKLFSALSQPRGHSRLMPSFACHETNGFSFVTPGCQDFYYEARANVLHMRGCGFLVDFLIALARYLTINSLNEEGFIFPFTV